MTRVALIAANPVLRAGLESMLRGAGFELVPPGLDGAEEFAGVEAVVLSADSRADVMDFLREPGAPPLVLIGPDSATLGELLDAGVRAVLPGNCSADELAAAIQAAAAGLVAFPASQAATLLDATPASAEAVPDIAPGVLSPRELEVLQMIAEGLANKEIAWRLGISEHTVKFHVASILNRLDASSRTQAVAIGLRRGMIML